MNLNQVYFLIFQSLNCEIGALAYFKISLFQVCWRRRHSNYILRCRDINNSNHIILMGNIDCGEFTIGLHFIFFNYDIALGEWRIVELRVLSHFQVCFIDAASWWEVTIFWNVICIIRIVEGSIMNIEKSVKFKVNLIDGIYKILMQ